MRGFRVPACRSPVFPVTLSEDYVKPYRELHGIQIRGGVTYKIPDLADGAASHSLLAWAYASRLFCKSLFRPASRAKLFSAVLFPKIFSGRKDFWRPSRPRGDSD